MKKQSLFLAIIGTNLLIIDQVIKCVARTLGTEPIIWTSWARWQLLFNDGIAFGIPGSRWLLVFVALVVSTFLIATIFVYNKYSSIQKLFLLLILVGAIGNTIDRMVFGVVTDMFSFWTFPVFNIADVCITLGVIGVLFDRHMIHPEKQV